MPLLPVYYTSLNLKKRKKRKSARQLNAEKEHQAYLKRMGFSGHRIKAITPAFQAENESSNLSARSIAPCSDVIPTWAPKKKPHTDHSFTIAPAYNKGSYQVISKKDVKDIGK
tara:strand:+ start:295 stop:633 length:339 start_codon:yes stop_codon:yes gene_type:complete